MAIGVASRFVLDTSLTLAWYFADEANPYADAVARSLPSGEAIVPSLWLLEVANAPVIGVRRSRSTEARASAFLARLRTLPIVLDDETDSRAWSDTIGLARAFSLSAYGASYLELAKRRGLPLATMDRKLPAAAVAAGCGRHSAH